MRMMATFSTWRWDRGSALHTSNRTVDTHVRTLRKKLRDDAHQPRFIETLHGVGYQFIAQEDDTAT